MMKRESGGDMRTQLYHDRSDMRTERSPRTPGRLPRGRMAAATLAAGGLVAALIAAGDAGAATSSMVSTAKSAKYGTILVSGNTVYTLKASKVSCGANCLKIWPEVLLPTGVMAATVGPGVNAAKLGTVMRQGGALQVTYAGKPLYWFFKDTGPGQVKGNIKDKWGSWSVVVTAKPAGSSSNSGSGSGSGSGGSSGSGGAGF
jgi:predicted lipoprotein with Yx(FWY)xxD motif